MRWGTRMAFVSVMLASFPAVFAQGKPEHAPTASGPIPIRVKAWYFPDTRQGYANIVLAGVVEPSPSVAWPAVTWTAEVASLDPATILRKWSAELAVPLAPSANGDTPARTGAALAQAPGQGNVWVQEMEMTPGQYVLVAAAHGLAGLQGRAEFPFQVNEPDPYAFLNISTLLLSDGCSSGAEKRSEDRHNLFDPLREGDCVLSPLITGVVRRGEAVRALLRLYPGAERPRHFPAGWRGEWTLSASGGAALRSWSAQIVHAAVRGWKINTELATENLSPGRYRLSVHVSGPDKREFTIADDFAVE